MYIAQTKMSVLDVQRLYLGSVTAAQTPQATITFQIGATGSDTSGNGSSNFPYITLQKAISSVRTAGYNATGIIQMQAMVLTLTGELFVGVNEGGLGEQATPLTIVGTRTTTFTGRVVNAVFQSSASNLVSINDLGGGYSAANVGQLVSFTGGSLAPFTLLSDISTTPKNKTVNVEAWISNVIGANDFEITYTGGAPADTFDIIDFATTIDIVDNVTFHGNGNMLVFQNIIFNMSATAAPLHSTMTFVDCIPVFQACRIIGAAGVTVTIQSDTGPILAPGNTHYFTSSVGFSAGLYIDVSAASGMSINPTSFTPFVGKGIVNTGLFNGCGGEVNMCNSKLDGFQVHIDGSPANATATIRNSDIANGSIINVYNGSNVQFTNCTIDSSLVRVRGASCLNLENVNISNAINNGIEVYRGASLYALDSGITGSAINGIYAGKSCSIYFGMNSVGISNNAQSNIVLFDSCSCTVENTSGGFVDLSNSSAAPLVDVQQGSTMVINTANTIVMNNAGVGACLNVERGGHIICVGGGTFTSSSTAIVVQEKSKVELALGTYIISATGITLTNESQLHVDTMTAAMSAAGSGLSISNGSRVDAKIALNFDASSLTPGIILTNASELNIYAGGTIQNATGSGISSNKECKLYISGATVSNNAAEGILIGAGSRATIYNTAGVGNTTYGVSVQSGSHTKVSAVTTTGGIADAKVGANAGTTWATINVGAAANSSDFAQPNPQMCVMVAL